ncbi:hypothetical protein [Ekhidna sp.]|uniref:hypothetical protein n=1 Tax=Ekhidna sp. TaxID=2608089 RepID=UPI003BACA5AF
MEDFWNWLIELNRFSGLAGCIYFVIFMKSWRRFSGVLFYILFASFLADNLNYFFIRIVYPNALYIGNSWVILNYFLSIFLFSKILADRNLLLKIYAGLFTVGTALSLTLAYDYAESNTFINVYSNITLISLSLLGYFELLKNPKVKLSKQPIFWIVTSFFIYNSVLILVSVFNNYLIFDLKISSDAYAMVSIINLSANILKNLLLFYSLVLIDKGFSPNLNPAEKT